MHRRHRFRWSPGPLCIAVLLAVVVPPTAASASRCAAYGNQHLYNVSRSISIFRDTWETHFTFRACWRPTNRTTLLGREYLDDDGLPRSLVIGYAAKGPWLVWGHRPATGHSGRYRLMSLNLVTGRRGFAVRQPADDVARDDSGPIPIDDDAFRLDVVATAHGNYAWLATDVVAATGGRIDALYTPDGRGHARLIDQGTPGSIRGLRAKGDVVTWTNAGQHRRADLRRSRHSR